MVAFKYDVRSTGAIKLNDCTVLKKLTHSEFRSTFLNPMNPVEDHEASGMEISLVIEHIIKEEKIKCGSDVLTVDFKFHNADKTYEQILVNFGEADHYIVILVDLKTNTLFGYFMLNLKKEYGLD